MIFKMTLALETTGPSTVVTVNESALARRGRKCGAFYSPGQGNNLAHEQLHPVVGVSRNSSNRLIDKRSKR